MTAEHVLSPEFWRSFTENQFERSPLVLKQPFSTPLATTAEVFQGLVNASEQYRAGIRLPPLRFYIGQAWQQAEIGNYLLEAADGSLACYAERISRKLQGRRFGLIVNEYQSYNPEIWFRIRNFLRGLYAVVGIPPNQSDTTIFLGNYERTPFGLHKDPLSVFTFVIEGQKRIVAWPDEVFHDRPEMHDSLDYEQFLGRATVLEAAAGDLIYWPSSHWHIAESTGELSLSLTVGIDFGFYSPIHIFSSVVRMLQNRLLSSGTVDAQPLDYENRHQSADRLHGIIERAAQALSDVSREAELEQTLRVAWMNHVTSFGFDGVPPPLPPIRLNDQDAVRVDSNFPLMWLTDDDDEIICSANGHAFSITAHPNIAKLFEELNKGDAHLVKRLVREYAGTKRVADVEYQLSRKEIRALLEKLCSLRAIHRQLSKNGS